MFSVSSKFISVRTRSAASSFSSVSLPSILVLTGPAAGNVSDIASAWNRIAASASTVEYTPHAPSHGSVRSSYLNPRTSRPSTYVSAHSLRLCTSPSISSIIPNDILANSSSSSFSARLSSNLESSSSSGMSDISTLPSLSVTSLGSTISISNISASGKSSSIPNGACIKPLSIAMVYS